MSIFNWKASWLNIKIHNGWCPPTQASCRGPSYEDSPDSGHRRQSLVNRWRLMRGGRWIARIMGGWLVTWNNNIWNCWRFSLSVNVSKSNSHGLHPCQSQYRSLARTFSILLTLFQQQQHQLTRKQNKLPFTLICYPFRCQRSVANLFAFFRQILWLIEAI